MGSFVLKGDIAYSKTKNELITFEDSYIVCIDGISKGVFTKLPKEYENLELIDYTGKLIIPGMVDLHIHAPQFNFRGTGMDLELLPWLNTYTFHEEKKFANIEYARKSYKIFADNIRKSATTRICVFATIHVEASLLLMNLMEETGIVSYIGKVNMDKADVLQLKEESMDSAYQTFGFINKATSMNYKNTYPILTPRFIPSCSDELLNELHEIVKTYNIPLQSHLSENKSEIKWVSELCPKSKFYGDAYDMYGLFGSESKTIMAHCVYSTDDEVKLIKKNGVYIANCPTSNANISSGIAPVRKYFDMDLNIGLGSDVAGGENESIFHAMVEQIKQSKMYNLLIDNRYAPITFAESFYMATIGGGKFFGNVGSFDEGYEFDCLVINDKIQDSAREMDIASRVERAAYLNLDINGIIDKYARGKKINIK